MGANPKPIWDRVKMWRRLEPTVFEEDDGVLQVRSEDCSAGVFVTEPFEEVVPEGFDSMDFQRDLLRVLSARVSERGFYFQRWEEPLSDPDKGEDLRRVHQARVFGPPVRHFRHVSEYYYAGQVLALLVAYTDALVASTVERSNVEVLEVYRDKPEVVAAAVLLERLMKEGAKREG